MYGMHTMTVTNSSHNVTILTLGDEVVYVPFVISCFGLIGNFMTFMTIIRTELRQNFANTYILVLLVSDSLVLFQMFLRLFVELDTLSFCWCVFVRYAWNSAIYVSNLAIISLTIERFFAIVYPLQHLQRSEILNRWKIILAWLVPILLFGANHLYALRSTAHDSVSIRFSVSSQADIKCNYENEKKFVDIFFHFPRLFFQFAFTFLVVTFVNIVIFIKLRARYVIIGQSGPVEMRSTNVLLAVIPVVYILLNLPFSIKNLIKQFQSNSSSTSFIIGHYFFVTGSYYLFCLNFAMNFVIYSLISPKFRRALCQVWFCQKRGDNRLNSATTRRTTVTDLNPVKKLSRGLTTKIHAISRDRAMTNVF